MIERLEFVPAAPSDPELEQQLPSRVFPGQEVFGRLVLALRREQQRTYVIRKRLIISEAISGTYLECIAKE